MLRPAILGAFGPTTLACLRSWGRRGWRPGLLAVQEGPGPRPASRHLAFCGTMPRSLLGTDEGLDAVRAFMERHGATSLACVSESGCIWLANNRRRLQGPWDLWVPPAGILERAIPKDVQADVARRVGMGMLPVHLLRKEAPLPVVPAEHFPLVLRPAKADMLAPSFKVRLAATPDDLRRFMAGLSWTRMPVVAQPFLDVPNLVVHGARTLGGRTIGQAAFLVERKFMGVTLTIRPWPLPADLARRCAAFADALELVGNHHFEFLFDPATGQSHFLELNPRFGGTTAKVLPLGYAEADICAEAFGGPPAPPQEAREGLAGSWTAVLKCLLATLRGDISPLDHPAEPAVRRIARLLALLPGLHDDVWNSQDLAGSLGLYGGLLPGAPDLGGLFRRGAAAPQPTTPNHRPEPRP